MYRLIDADREIGEVCADILNIVNERFALRLQSESVSR
jgi:hypothetical protein